MAITYYCTIPVACCCTVLVIVSVHNLSLHDTLDLLLCDLRDFPTHCLTHLLLDRSFDFLPNGVFILASHDEPQLFLRYVSDLF